MAVLDTLPLVLMLIVVIGGWILIFYLGPRFTSRTISKIKKLSIDDNSFAERFFEMKPQISEPLEHIIAERNTLYKTLWLDSFSENLLPDTKFHDLVILCESDTDLITKKNREHAYEFLINLRRCLESINNTSFSVSSSMTIADIIEILLIFRA